jgi:outer membrane immunogenic protein
MRIECRDCDGYYTSRIQEAFMRRVLLAGVFILPFVTGAAFAADLPSAAPAPAPAPYAPPPPVFTWTGFYVGGYVGRQWNDTSFPRVDGVGSAPSSINASGVVGGGIIGGNYQFNNFVIGAEGDLGAASVSRTNAGTSGGFAVTNHISQDWIGRIRGRAGVAYGNALIFAAAGVSFDDERLTVNSPAFQPPGRGSSSQTGWNIGGGVDYAFTNNWFGRVEYIYDNFPGKNIGLTNGYAARHVKTTDSTVRVAIGYKF